MRLIEVFFVALKLGLTSFGGPVAHLGYFRREYVERRRWLTDDTYADLMALCQFLPGPASSQVGFAVGMRRAGILGGLAAWLGFTFPSAILMIAFAYGVMHLGDIQGAGWLRGLKIAAVAVVADAVWKMSGKLCPDRVRLTLAVAAAAVLLLAPLVSLGRAWVQVALILAGAGLGWLLFRESTGSIAAPKSSPYRHGPVVLGLCGFFLLLVLLPTMANLFPTRAFAYFDSFYRSGSLVFGGGHVVLPLLEAEVVESGWMGQDVFLAGYGAAQALPGPLFAFSAYLGAAMELPPNGILGGVICLVAIYLPSWLLVVGVLPVWDRARAAPAVQAALKGTNAVVVGILLAALFHPVWTAAVDGATAFVVVLVSGLLLVVWRWPSWAVVVLASGVGELLL
jgi:chromate transporter